MNIVLYLVSIFFSYLLIYTLINFQQSKECLTEIKV